MCVYKKINKVMSEVTSVVKNKEIEMGRNSYTVVQHDDVTAALQPSMVKHGLVAIPTITKVDKSIFISEKEYKGKVTKTTHHQADVHVDVTFIDSDKPESQFVTHSFSYAFDSGDKAVGKAYSMAVKYAYLKTFMLESKDNEEERQQKNYNAQRSPQAPVAAPPQPARQAQPQKAATDADYTNLQPFESKMSTEFFKVYSERNLTQQKAQAALVAYKGK